MALNYRQIEAIGLLLSTYHKDLNYFQAFQDFKNGKIDEEQYCMKCPGSFQDFTDAYRVSRNFKKGQTLQLLRICKSWYDNNQWADINGLAATLFHAEIAHGHAVSLASKVMFLMRPETVLPYDRQAKNTLGLKQYEKDYTDFLQRADSFEKANHKVLDESLIRVSNLLGVLENRYPRLDLPFQQVRRLRLLDKLLWTGPLVAKTS